jgi:hypothetical protein
MPWMARSPPTPTATICSPASPGTYSVQFDKTTLPAGYSFTTANTGADAPTPTPTCRRQDRPDRPRLRRIRPDLGRRHRRQPGTITGTVLEDTNNDNVGDTPIAGVTVVLKDRNGTVVPPPPPTPTATTASTTCRPATTPRRNQQAGLPDVGDATAATPT